MRSLDNRENEQLTLHLVPHLLGIPRDAKGLFSIPNARASVT